MNVLYLINFAGKAGTEKYVENLVRILGVEKTTPFLAYNVPGELSEKLEKAGIPTLQVKMGKTALFSAAKKLAEFCRENEIDVIHAQYPRENIVALLSLRHFSVPRVLMTNHLTLRLSGLSGFIWRRLNSYFTPKNHRIIAVCNEGRDIMIKNGVKPEKISVIFNGIEPSGFVPPPEGKRRELGIYDDCFVMTILARFAPEKGLDFLLDVLNDMKSKTDKPFCCLICGDGELFGGIQTRITEMGLDENCKPLGFRRDTREILLCSDTYVCSSMCNEAMSFAVLEAMDCGLPLVLTDVGGNRDLAENRLKCGYILPYGDVHGFSEKLLLLMDDLALRASLADASREKTEKYFDLNKLAMDVYNAYN